MENHEQVQMFTVLEITREPYEVFEGWKFMDVMIDKDGCQYEVSIVEPLISEILNAQLPYTVGKGDKQLKLF